MHISLAKHLKDSVIARFAARAQRFGGIREDVSVMEHSTEELVDTLSSGRTKEMFARGPAGARMRIPGKALARLEENYLYASRRFPALSNNTIGSGALTTGAFPFFGVANGGLGDSVGFPTGFVLSLNETNMELGGQIPQGQSFVFNQIGVSFNADCPVADAQVLMDSVNLSFSKSGGGFSINHGPLKMWPGGFGAGGFAGGGLSPADSEVTANAASSAANGAIDVRAVRNLRIARVLKANDVFSYALNVPRTTKANDGTAIALSAFAIVTIWLWGGFKSAIQG
jgi:hypothetical protein